MKLNIKPKTNMIKIIRFVSNNFNNPKKKKVIDNQQIVNKKKSIDNKKTIISNHNIDVQA